MGLQAQDEARPRTVGASGERVAAGSAEPAEASVELRDVHLSYGRRPVLRGLSCRFPAGAISVILGGSGSGKSTILKAIGGLIPPRSGSIDVGGSEIRGLGERQLYLVRRRLGMMFQNGALLDSMTVFENLAFPLREHTKLSEAEIADRVHESLGAVGLRDVDALLPRELSGGMVKRVALARSLVRRPEILLVDEPFSGLDPLSTKLIEALLVRINRSYGVTMIVVSHHIPSTMRMADRIVLLLPDDVVTGAPRDLAASDDARVRRFLTEETDDTEEVFAKAAEFEQGERHPPRRAS